MNKLKELQSKIDEVNSQILNLIVKRNQIVKKIGKHKKEKNLPISNLKKEKEIFNKLMISAERKGLNTKFISKLFTLILKQSKVEQKKQK